jgi:uncharacterized membrane protein YfcA
VEVSLYNILQFVVIGTVAGFLGGFLGVGGGIVIIPLLRYWAFPSMNISPEVIVHLSFGTSLAIIIPTSLSGSLAHSKTGNVLWRVVMPLVLLGIPGSLLGSSFAAYLQGPLLIRLFGLLLIVLSVQMYFQKKEVAESEKFLAPSILPTLLTGFLVGIFSGFFGVGGGVIAIPLMARFLGIPLHRTLGISIAFVFFTSLVGTIGYIFNGLGHPHLPPFTLGYVHVLGWLLAGIPSIFLGQWGAGLAYRTKPLRLRRVLAVLLLLVGIRLLL